MNRKLWTNPREAGMYLGISVKTLRRWVKAEKLHVARKAGHHRHIGLAEIRRLQRQGEQAARCALYARVSTGLQAQDGNLARQRERLLAAAAEREYQVVQTDAEYALSLNEKRRDVKKRLSLMGQQAVNVVLLDYPDRLERFGFSSLQETFRWQQVRLEVLDLPAQVDPTTDLLAEMLTTVTIFSERPFASRAHSNPRRKKALPMLVSKSEQEERSS